MAYVPVPYALPRRTEAEMLEAAAGLLARMRTRRSCRAFSDEPVPRELIECLVAAAHTSPSGANRQPWQFVAVDDLAIKHEIRVAAEAEERESYARRMPPAWLAALEPLGTDAHKPFLDVAPWLVIIFQRTWEYADSGERTPNYYPVESVGLAAGMFLTACHLAGLATLTHTPSPMKFLREILRRPENEKPYLLIPVGYPARDCMVPQIDKKPLRDVLQWNR
ncbi:MAG TPA: nitroreductase family protein [Phycisphaerae bacterium]|nr:nitroreductase family protein [Phycisphaerales bacterium]HRX84187.1 nitroreductase family protein [Phycisphaerae bacterium]